MSAKDDLFNYQVKMKHCIICVNYNDKNFYNNMIPDVCKKCTKNGYHNKTNFKPRESEKVMEINNLKISQITIGKDFKISKNYNSIGASMTVTIELGENDNLNDVIAKGYELINEKCKEQLKFKGDENK